MTTDIYGKLIGFQKSEITEHHIYRNFAFAEERSARNRKVLENIAEDELRHYRYWRAYTRTDVDLDRFKVSLYGLIRRVFGLAFCAKLMEWSERGAQARYARFKEQLPDAAAIAADEQWHKKALIGLLNEERQLYSGAVILGLNDALIEFTGALAGFSLALQNTKLIILTGSITGIAAALSMAASEYLSVKAENTVKNPFKASLCTGWTYLFTVALLIVPYCILRDHFQSLALTVAVAVALIAVLNYYLSVAKKKWFSARFFEMAGISLGIAAASFLIGYALRRVIGL